MPACYWLFGGADAGRFWPPRSAGTLDRDIPSNHSPLFAPLVEPTLDDRRHGPGDGGAGLARRGLERAQSLCLNPARGRDGV